MTKDGKLRSLGNGLLTTAFIAIICIPIILLVVWLIGGILAIAYESKICANELNNPFINADYKNWSTIELINEETIMLPDEWSITTTESLTVITDEYGKNIAKGGKLVQDENGAYQYEELLGELFDQPVSIAAITELGNVRSSRYGTITIADNGATEYDYILLSKSANYNMLFVFDPTVKETQNNLTDILEAMIFSYVWK